MIRFAFIIYALLLVSHDAPAAQSEPIPLWPNGAPGEHGGLAPEADTTTAKDDLVAGRPLVRIGNVATPTLTFYQPQKDKQTGAAVIVFPGGGYRILALDLEGSEICEWLNSIGVVGVLLKYRVPAEPNSARHEAPLQDAQRALRLVRALAPEHGIDAKRIGILGFSAGGHLAAYLSNHYEEPTYRLDPVTDKDTCRPDFAILIYPAYLTEKNDLTKLAPELVVTAKTPPSFMVQTEDDPVHVENVLIYYEALKQATVPAELHVFSSGGHGYGSRPDASKPVTEWPKLAEKWMRSRQMLNSAAR